MKKTFYWTALIVGVVTVHACSATDWPMRGFSSHRNPVTLEKNAPVHWNAEPANRSANVRWMADVGYISLGTPVVSDGFVWIGTIENRNGHDDASVLMCLREFDGKVMYQYVSPRLPNGRQYDWPNSSLASSPLIEHERLWFCTNRCEVVCLDISGLLNGNGDPRELWKLDLRETFGVVPRSPMIGTPSSHCSIAGFGDRIFVNTNNSRQEGGAGVSAPDAPSLVCLKKDNGELLWSDNSPGENIMYAQFGNPTVFELDGVPQVVIGQGDGWIRSFVAESGELLWQFNINTADAKPEPFFSGKRNYIPTAPVYYANKIYAVAGTDPEAGGLGAGRIVCIDPRGRGDVSSDRMLPNGSVVPNENSAMVWEQTGTAQNDRRNFDPNVIQQSIAGLALHRRMLIAADMRGFVRCYDAATGEQLWTHNLDAAIYATPLIADDKIYIATEDGIVSVFSLARTKRHLADNEHDHAIECGLVYANQRMLILSRSRLWAISEE